MELINFFRSWFPLLLLLTGIVDAHGNAGHAHEAAHEKRQAQAQKNGRERWNQLHRNYLASVKANLEPGGQCTWDNMVVRREWGDMNKAARLEYFRALHCLKEKPGRTDRTKYPGARSRWDDFTIAHMLNVERVHRSPWLAIWHRQYTWALEQALRDECGYKWGLPYWHWSRYLDQPIETWPLFDNSETSISGNGTQRGPRCACVESGPFANWTVTLGPQGQGTWGCKRNPRPDGLGYNPACIERTFHMPDLNSVKYEDVVYTIDQGSNATRFAQLVELEYPSVHNAPHVFMGGTQIDVTFSSQDPWFFFHHGMVDCLFAVWQSVDWKTRTRTVPDPAAFEATRSQGWSMPVPEVHLDSEIFLSSAFDNVTVRDAMWPTKNQYCYRYE